MISFLFRSDSGDIAQPGDLVVRLGDEISSREQLFDRLSVGLEFPGYFGRNWDALDDCLRDLHWVEGKRVVILHDTLPSLPDDDLRIYLEILARAVEDWRPDEQHEVVVVFPASAELRVRGLLRSSDDGTASAK